jgi:hypothetical protein
LLKRIDNRNQGVRSHRVRSQEFRSSGGRKKEEGRRKKEEGRRRKKESGRSKSFLSSGFFGKFYSSFPFIALQTIQNLKSKIQN